jgi:hypothetical protein
VIGAIVVQVNVPSHAYNLKSIRLIKFMAEQLAVVIERKGKEKKRNWEN